jgi:6,7-dimethyl-8-ribityllumazine synthase
MSVQNKNLSHIDKLPNGADFRIGIAISKWNDKVTNALLKGAFDTLISANVPKDAILIIHVPGTFELPLATQKLACMQDVDAVIAIGCVIQGETPHFDFICDAAANGMMNVGLKYNKPCIFGVLTTLTEEQALDRAGGKHGNKGVEAAVTALEMLSLSI